MEGDVIPLDAKRTPDQNDKLWPMLRDFAKQVKQWHTNSRGDWVCDYMGEKAWKAVLTAAFVKKPQMAQALDGDGVVMVGVSTSDMKKLIFSDLIEFIYASGADRGVQWSEKSEALYRAHCRPKEAANG